MRKKSKYKPRPLLTDPVAYVVESSTLLADHGTYVIDWKLKNHGAMEMLIKGLAKKPHMDTIVAARNITEGLMVVLDGPDVDGTLVRSGAALMDVCDRANSGKGTTLRAPEMQALRDMMALHDELLDVVTVGQMEKAIAYVKKEISAGRAGRLKDLA
jgi:hypothetical protein